MTDVAWNSDKLNKNIDRIGLATTKMLSLEYRELSFKLILMAPDSLLRSYNNLMQHFFNSGETTDTDAPRRMIELLGKLLIEIRKSMGNESTNLDHWEMCEFWMTDVKTFKNDV